jgi:hypothetical protein
MAEQALAANLAWQAKEADHSARSFLIALGRDEDVPADVLASRLGAVANLPWITPTRLGTAMDRPAGVSALLRPGQAPHRGPDARSIAALDTASTHLDAFASITENPDGLTATFEPDLLAPLALAAGPAKARTAAARSVLGQLEEMFAQVTVVTGPSLTLISEAGELPVAVANALAQTVRIRVTLQPAARTLVANKPVDITLPAGSQETLRLPVRALANGNVEVAVILSTLDGRPISQAATFRVRVRAEWETVGMMVFAGAVALAFLIGLVRTIARRRARPRGARA